VVQSANAANIYVVTAPDGITARTFVDCEIENHSDRCQLDTGSAFPLISGPLDYLKSNSVTGHQDAMSAQNVKASCEDLALTSKVKVTGQVLPLSEIKRCQGFPMELSPSVGVKVFDGFRINMDFPHRQFNWNTTLQPNVLSSFKRSGIGWISMNALLGTSRIEVFFDTGAQLSAVDEKYVSAHPEKFKLVTSTDVTDATGTKTKQNVYEMEVLTMLGRAFSNNYAVAIDFSYFHNFFPQDVVILLGMNHIQQASWFLDFQNSKWGFLN